MIAASDPQEFVPFGRQHIKDHPAFADPKVEPPLPVESMLIQRLSEVNIEDTGEDEFWLVRDGATDSEYSGRLEEELYVSGSIAVGSKGLVGRCSTQASSSLLHTCYTMESPIRQALWCNFHSFDKDNNSVEVPSLCLIDSTRIKVYTDGGEDYICPLQFKVASAWQTKYGLLLERVSHCPSSSVDNSHLFTPTTIFSLMHPLNEISPLLAVRHAGQLSYMSDPCLKVVFTSEEPSLCVLVDLRSGLHSIWKLRKATPREVQLMGANDTSNNLSLQNGGFSNVSTNGSMSMLNSKLSFGKTVFYPCISLTNASSVSSRTNSYNGTASGSPIFHSPVISRLSGVHSRSLRGSPGSPASIDARLATSQMLSSNVLPKPIVPEICLDFIWSDQPPSRSSCESVGGGKKEGKVFLTVDLLGQQFLCYPSYNRVDTLVCARLTRTNSELNPDIIIGSTCFIQARDAVPLPSVSMMAVLEPNSSVVLYTGPLAVGKIALAGVTAELASSSYLTASASISTALPSNYKRLSLLSSTVIGEGSFFDDRQLLSPVSSPDCADQFHHHRLLSSTPGPNFNIHNDLITSLRDPTSFSFTAEFQNGSMFRFSLPAISSSPLVGECIRVLKCILQKDDALHTLSKWYSVRNAPGTQDISPDFEWQLFISTLLGLLGYELESLPLMKQYSNTDYDTPGKPTKKRRASDLGSQEDWEYLMTCGHNCSIAEFVNLPGNSLSGSYQKSVKCDPAPMVNTAAPLFQHIYTLLFSLHLLYEEMKLNSVLSDCLPLLAKLLHQLSCDLALPLYSHHYWIDFPDTCPLVLPSSQIDEESMSQVAMPPYMSHKPPCVFSYILSLVQGADPQPFPFINGVNNFTKDVLSVVGKLKCQSRTVLQVAPPGTRCDTTVCDSSFSSDGDLSPAHSAVLLMHSLGMKKEMIELLPFGVGLILSETLQAVCEKPLPGWSSDVYTLIGRLDMVPCQAGGDTSVPLTSDPLHQDVPRQSAQPSDYITKVLSLRFTKDQRVLEVVRLLDSSEPVTVAITQRPEVTDHEFIEEQERHLYTICNRTMALPVGRGMMELHTEEPVSSEPLTIPKICLSGRAPPRGTTIEFSHIEVVPNMTLWPLFHNGVAAGLRIAPHANINSTWISFNKPKNGGNESLPEHAGFLMALGLSGHLNSFNEFSLYEYLTKCHEMTSVGLLLGLAASKRGTMDVRTTKLFSVHIESLLPPTSIELDVVQNVQVAALLGVGLLYQGTGHRHIAEVLLSEIGRPPGPEMENSTDRECYSLAAGLGLGLVILGKGANPVGLQDLGITDTLHHYMVGGRKRPLTGSQKEKYKNPSYQIREEDRVNNNVTAPGAILALGLMYFNTGNRAVASWLDSPESEYMLSFVCPDLLLLRIVARGLILWEDIRPTIGWVESHVPETILRNCLIKPRSDSDNIDYETINQAYINLLAGACFAMGLRFAGSANRQAYLTLLHFCRVYITLSTKSISELTGKSTIEICINVVLISLAMVMSGTGDLEVVRLCRFLRARVTNSVVTYGSHLATHMALGLLYLGGGAYTLSTTPEAVAALVCAFFPRFPTHSNDNRYHLQALRHLYVLAAEPRLILPRDIDSGQLCYANLSVVFLDTDHYKDQTCTLYAPCLLPELHLLKEVKIDDSRYWPVVFHRDKNWDQLIDMLKNLKCVGVKLRAGCLPYVEDPHGFRTLLAQTLSTDQASAWAKNAEMILTFVSDVVAKNLMKELLETSAEAKSATEIKLTHWLSKISYECITRDKLPLLRVWLDILKHLAQITVVPSSRVMWQLRLVLAHGLGSSADSESHLPTDLILCLQHSLISLVNLWESEMKDTLKSYISSSPLVATDEVLAKLSCYLTYYGFPPREVLSNTALTYSKNQLLNKLKLKECDVSSAALNKIFKIINM